jgi:hypothetical protein
VFFADLVGDDAFVIEQHLQGRAYTAALAVCSATSCYFVCVFFVFILLLSRYVVQRHVTLFFVAPDAYKPHFISLCNEHYTERVHKAHFKSFTVQWNCTGTGKS